MNFTIFGKGLSGHHNHTFHFFPTCVGVENKFLKIWGGGGILHILPCHNLDYSYPEMLQTKNGTIGLVVFKNVKSLTDDDRQRMIAI